MGHFVTFLSLIHIFSRTSISVSRSLLCRVEKSMTSSPPKSEKMMTAKSQTQLLRKRWEELFMLLHSGMAKEENFKPAEQLSLAAEKPPSRKTAHEQMEQ